MKIYDVQQMCIENDYFTCGCNFNYEKMFELVKADMPLNIIARCIWLCSEADYDEIFTKLVQLKTLSGE